MENLSFGDYKKMNFAEIIIAELRKRKITQQEVANEIGENYNTLKQWLYGKRTINETVAKKLCDYLDLDYKEVTKNDPYLNALEISEISTFGEKLRKILKAKNIGHSEFAEAINISPGNLSYIINDKRTIKLKTLCEICGYLNVNIYNMIKDDPKYATFSNQFATPILSLFEEAGITNLIPNYKDVLLSLIKDNKKIFQLAD